MVKTTIEEIITNKQIYAEVFSKVFPSNTSFRFMMLVDDINRYILYYEKTMQMLKDQYMIQDKTSEEFKMIFREGGKEELDIEFNKLLKQEIELNFEPISVDELGDKHGLNPLQMLAIKNFLKV